MATRNSPNEPQNQQTSHAAPQQSAGTQSTGTSASTRTGSQATQSSQGSQSGQARTSSDRERPVQTSREQGRGTNVARRSSSNTSMSQPTSSGLGLAGGPFGLMRQLSDDVDRLFEQFGFGRALTPRLAGIGDLATVTPQLPEVDMFRRGDEIVVRADLPGLSRNDVSVDIENDVLSIRGERQEENSNNREDFYWSERRYGAFERDIPLPEGVNADQAKATFRDGVLEVTVPAPKAQGQRGHRVDIQ